MNTTSPTLTISLDNALGDIPLTMDERGDGKTVIILHGGAGPASVTGFADLLAEATDTRVIVPTHPGFAGTPRPEQLSTMAGLAELYAGLIAALHLDDVTVIGNSMGGWIAAELATRDLAQLTHLALVDAVGIEVSGHPVAGSLPPAQLIEHSWYDPTKAPTIDPAALPPAARTIMAGNRAALELYCGPTMGDPGLLARLSAVTVPTLVLWGEADRIADPDYGRAYADAIPGARFELLTHTGHVPQLETPQTLLAAVRDFVGMP